MQAARRKLSHLLRSAITFSQDLAVWSAYDRTCDPHTIRTQEVSVDRQRWIRVCF
jgi:hypothetical protein